MGRCFCDRNEVERHVFRRQVKNRSQESTFRGCYGKKGVTIIRAWEGEAPAEPARFRLGRSLALPKSLARNEVNRDSLYLSAAEPTLRFPVG